MSLLRYNHCLDYAGEFGSPQYRCELEFLMCFIRGVLADQQIIKALLFQHSRLKAFDIFLVSKVEPCIASYLDARSLCACEGVSKTWQTQLALHEDLIWDNLCTAKFFVRAASFLRGKGGEGGEEGVAPKPLYRLQHGRLRALLSLGGGDRGVAGIPIMFRGNM